MKSVTFGGTIVLTSESPETTYPIRFSLDCPLDTIYFLPTGSTTRDLDTGQTLRLAPGYWVNLKQLGMIRNVKEP